MSDGNMYKCEFCKQDYSSYKSRWLHIKKYHKNNNTKNVAKLDAKIDAKNRRKEYSCEYCKNNFTRKDSLIRHQEGRCKKKDDNIINDTKFQEAVHKEIELFKSDFFKAMKVHPSV